MPMGRMVRGAGALRRGLFLALAALAACGGSSMDGPGPLDAGSDLGAPFDSGSAICTRDQECGAAHCDVVSGACVECTAARHCALGAVCVGNGCAPAAACVSGVQCPGLVCGPGGSCQECASDLDCLEAATFCDAAGRCQPRACTPGAQRCLASGMHEVCSARGDAYVAAPCGAGQACSPTTPACSAQVCSPSGTRCAPDSVTAVLVCDAFGLGESRAECGASMSCNLGACLPRICSPGAVMGCSDGTHQSVCATDGLGYAPVACAASTSCLTGVCTPWTCTPGSERCTAAGQHEVCDSTGLAFVGAPCATGTSCDVSTVVCAPWVCTPGAARCTVGSVTGYETCDADGRGETHAECGANTSCNGGACLARVCSPGAVTGCVDTTAERTCTTDGLGYVSTPCAGGEACVGGACTAVVCTPGATRCASATSAATCSADGQSESIAACVNGGPCLATSCEACGSLSLNGSSCASGPPVAAPSSPFTGFTVETWVRIAAGAGSSQHYVLDTRTPAGAAGFGINVDTDRVQFWFAFGGPFDFITTAVTAGVWHHVAGVWNGTQRVVYVDGVLVGAPIADTAGPTFNTGNVRLGCGAGGGGALSGLIDSVRVSTVARYSGSSFTPPRALVADASTFMLHALNASSGTLLDDTGSANDDLTVSTGTAAWSTSCAFGP